MNPEDAQSLLAEARAAAANAYCPYSDLAVGAVVVGESGAHYRGANVENAAFPSTLCAEASAIGHAISSGEKALAAVAVISPDLTSIQPCGQCRQRMVEFGVKHVVMEGPDGEPVIEKLESLFPRGFSDWR